MRRLLFLIVLSPLFIQAQDLPVGMTPEEQLQMSWYKAPVGTAVLTPPAYHPRAIAEWEEIKALLITWTSYTSVLADIVDAAQEECLVLIACDDSMQVKSYLNGQGIPLTNVRYLEVGYNSVWIRDYGAHMIYQNDVSNPALVDWTYNRPRPEDDVMPVQHASYFGLSLYQMTNDPWDLVATGGNLMFDGFGTAMSSELIQDENTGHTAAEIDTIMNRFLGASRYIAFPTLPYDGIHHIDMHMKLLDEETILVGEYPNGISDGPQIEANLQYLLSNYNSVYGTPYKVVRIPMLPNASGTSWPSTGSYYRTYTNGVFVNKTYIYPSYYEKYDTTAWRIYKETLVGYTLVPIDCDPDPISASGAIHCITNCIGVSDPLLISHHRLDDTYNTATPYQIDAYINHKNGISSANVYYRTDTLQPYQSASMTLTNATEHTWTGYIPQQIAGSKVYYYIQASAVGGKTQVRPITAPEGYWKFNILSVSDINLSAANLVQMEPVFPNPAANITCIPVNMSKETSGSLLLLDVTGRIIETLHEGNFPSGKSHYFFDASLLESGTYMLMLSSNNGVQVQKVIVR